jgi:hypothetical protein
LLKYPEKRKRKQINKMLMDALTNNDEEAMAVFSLLLFPTNLMWAFFNRFDFVDSNNVVTTRKKAHTPICGLLRLLINIRKLTKPKRVKENRCKKV